MFDRRFFEHPHRPRLFEKGDLKYVILDLLKDKPAHGYEIIRALEERFYGFYSPSAGSIYPTLQLLEDMEYVRSAEQDGKKVYTITAGGREFLKGKRETMDRIKSHMHGWCGDFGREEVHEIMHEMRYLARSMAKKLRGLDTVKLAQVREIISRAQREIDAIS